MLDALGESLSCARSERCISHPGTNWCRDGETVWYVLSCVYRQMTPDVYPVLIFWEYGYFSFAKSGKTPYNVAFTNIFHEKTQKLGTNWKQSPSYTYKEWFWVEIYHFYRGFRADSRWKISWRFLKNIHFSWVYYTLSNFSEKMTKDRKNTKWSLLQPFLGSPIYRLKLSWVVCFSLS